MKSNVITLTAVAALALTVAACSSGLQNAEFQTGSQSITQSSDYQRVYVANTDAGSVSIVLPGTGVIDTVDVGAEPTKVARAGDLVFVTLRAEGAVAVLRESGEGLVFEGRIEVGPDPVGVVASEDGSRVYVAVAMADQIVEIDAVSSQILRRFSVPNQPRWVALHPSGETLYAASAFGGTWASIDLSSEQVGIFELPTRERFVFNMQQGTEDVVNMAHRITGDISVSPDGEVLVIPSLYVDNQTPVNEPGQNDDGSGYSASSGGGISRINPGITVYDTGADGRPTLTSARTIFASVNMVRMDGQQDEFRSEHARSFIASTVVAPDSMVVLATMEGSEAVVAVPLHVEGNGDGRHEFREQNDVSSMEFRSLVGVSTGATGMGPRGVVFLDRNRAIVDTWMDRKVSEVPYAEVRDGLRSMIVDGHFMDGDEGFGLQTFNDIEVVQAAVSPQITTGRKMFYRATDNRMAAHSGGISCSTCHIDGRNDGLTWTFKINDMETKRQTPSLVGNVSLTAPVTWTSSVPSVSAEVRITSSGRMGGDGVSVLESEDVTAYVDSTPYPPRPPVADAAAVERGKAIFEGSAECSSCHSGDLLTDSKPYNMFDLPNVRTPTLRGIAATAPYGHDGSAATLAELVQIAENRGMGKTNHLSTEQRSDLVAYLKTL